MANLMLLLVLLWLVGTTRSPDSASPTTDLPFARADESELPEGDLRTSADAKALIEPLGESPQAGDLADAIMQIEGWIAVDDEQAELNKLRKEQIARLRDLVAEQLSALHDQALNATSSSRAIQIHAKAGQLLALYPIEGDPQALEEAGSLANQHSSVAVRLEAIRRQRYNLWALTRSEEAIQAVDQIATSFRKADNLRTIQAVVDKLEEVDPMLLEPLVAQFYNHAIEYAKSNVNSEQQFQLAKELVDPKKTRKGYGDF